MNGTLYFSMHVGPLVGGRGEIVQEMSMGVVIELGLGSGSVGSCDGV